MLRQHSVVSCFYIWDPSSSTKLARKDQSGAGENKNEIWLFLGWSSSPASVSAVRSFLVSTGNENIKQSLIISWMKKFACFFLFQLFNFLVSTDQSVQKYFAWSETWILASALQFSCLNRSIRAPRQAITMLHISWYSPFTGHSGQS